jgi:hypothetical protein
VTDATKTGGSQQTVVYPSAHLRPPTSFVLSCPPDWTVSEAPGALLSGLEPAFDDQVRGTFSVVHQRVPADTTRQSVAKASWLTLSAVNPEAALVAQSEQTINGRPIHIMATDVPAVGMPTASQIQATFFAPPTSETCADLFMIVCMASRDRMEDLGPVFLSLIASFTFV